MGNEHGRRSRSSSFENEEDDDYMTPISQGDLAVQLFKAISEGTDEHVNTLIKAGADVNTVDESGETALMMAVANSRVNCVQRLLTAGADVNKGFLLIVLY